MVLSFFCSLEHSWSTELVVAEGDASVAEVCEKGVGFFGEGGVDFHKNITTRDERFFSDLRDGAVEAERVFIGHEKSDFGFMFQYDFGHL